MPSSTVEDYLKAILLRQGAEGQELVPMGQVGADLGVAPGTVTAMAKALADSGLLRYEPYAGVRLTAAGEQLALHVLRRHRLIELFLVRVVGLDWSEVHEDAERLEHAVSERLIERIDELLGHPQVDPHGDPIPSHRGDLPPQDHLAALLDCPAGSRFRVSRVLDQSEDFLRLLEREGLTPGSQWELVARDEAADIFELARDGRRLGLGCRAAGKLLVEVEAAADPGGGLSSPGGAGRVRSRRRAAAG